MLKRLGHEAQQGSENLEVNRGAFQPDRKEPMSGQHHRAEKEGAEPSVRRLGRTRKLVRAFYDRSVRLHGSPEQIAWGAAVGFFVAMTPTMGIQTYLAVPIAALFGFSKVAAAATVWITNPVTAPFLYGLSYMIGAKLLGYPLKTPFLSNPSWETFWHAGEHVMLALTLGGVITGVIVAIVGYFVVLAMVRTAREKAEHLKLRRKVKE